MLRVFNSFNVGKKYKVVFLANLYKNAVTRRDNKNLNKFLSQQRGRAQYCSAGKQLGKTMSGLTSCGRMRVFVYGTLKNGQPNHHWLSQPDNGYQKFLGQAASVNKFPLVIASR